MLLARTTGPMVATRFLHALILIRSSHQRPSSKCARFSARHLQTSIIALAFFQIRHEDWSSRSSPLLVRHDYLFAAISIEQMQLQEQTQAFSIDMTMRKYPDFTTIPAIAEHDAQRVCSNL